MRSRLRQVVVAAALLAVSGCRAEPTPSDPSNRQTVGRQTVARPAHETFYPLAVGNSWTLRCSSEGQVQFDKTIRLTSESVSQGARVYRAELTRTNDSGALVYYLFESPAGVVQQAATPNGDAAEALVGSSIKQGDRVGALVAARLEKTEVLTAGIVEVVRLENFSAEDPNLSENKRLDWLGRSYAKGIGPLDEADGLGNECVLLRYQVAGR